MTLRRSGRAALVLALVAVLIPLVSCGKKVTPRKTTTPWPVAESERRVTGPAGLAKWPLTGLSATDAAITARIVSVKIENAPEARPQSGLDRADVVYETLTEGGISRFNALFHSQAPATVGPVRSARLSDVYIVPQYAALFARAGANAVVQQRIKKARLQDMNEFTNAGPYRRSPDRKAPHNLYVDIAKLRAAAVRRGYPAKQELRTLAFGAPQMSSAATASAVTVPFSPSNRVRWVYDGGTRMYSRALNGQPHADRESGKQYTSRNIVVMWAKTTNANITRKGYQTLEISLVGKGQVAVFRDGVRYDGTWEAPANEPPRFRAADGKLIKLAPGKTWFQVVPTSVNITME